MTKLLYIETSIPSFYFDTRTDPLMVARRRWTRHWWDMPKPDVQLVTGAPVHAELDRAPSPKRERALHLIRDLEILPPDPEIE